jgi:hypothetical protein
VLKSTLYVRFTQPSSGSSCTDLPSSSDKPEWWTVSMNREPSTHARPSHCHLSQAQAIPWYHYVPVQYDYSDLWDIMSFLDGAPDGSTHRSGRYSTRYCTSWRGVCAPRVAMGGDAELHVAFLARGGCRCQEVKLAHDAAMLMRSGPYFSPVSSSVVRRPDSCYVPTCEG